MASSACETLKDCWASGERSDSKWYLLELSVEAGKETTTVTVGMATLSGGRPRLERSCPKLLECDASSKSDGDVLLMAGSGSLIGLVFGVCSGVS